MINLGSEYFSVNSAFEHITNGQVEIQRKFGGRFQGVNEWIKSHNN
jgi:hypothetical protein